MKKFSTKTTKEFLRKKRKLLLLLVIVIALFCVPQLFWKDYGYFVGGDDSLLHYMYPTEMIDGFAKNIAVNNTLSGPPEYIERLELLPFLYLISAVNFVTGTPNSLYIFLGFIVAASFLSMFFLLNEIEPKYRDKLFIEKCFISLLYTFSVHHFLSVMNYKLAVMYIVFLVPYVLFLFVKAMNKNRPIYLIPAAIVASLFSVVLAGIPWLSAFTICTAGLLLYLLLQHPKRFVDFSFRLFLLLLLLNIYWVFHFVFAIVSGTSQTNVFSGVLSQEFRERNIEAVLSVTSGNELYDSMLGLFHPNLQKNFNWPSYVLYENWYAQFRVLNILLLVCICLACVLYERRTEYQFFPYAVLGWLVALYFFTVNMFGTYGTYFFLKLNEIVPGFSMFRNNYDKFASGFAFTFCLLLFATSLQLQRSSNVHRYLKATWIVLLVLYSALTIAPVVQGKFERDIFITTEKTRAQVASFDHRFIEFAERLPLKKGTSILWMPLSGASYIVVNDDQNSDYVFAGISPLLYLSGVHDYAGKLSFRSPDSNVLSIAIESQDGKAFGELLKRLGITHIAVNNTLTEDMKGSYVYGYDYLTKQNSEFMAEFLGEKVFSVDDAYILYKVRDTYYQEQFYFTNNCIVTSIDLIAREKFKITYKASGVKLSEPCHLVFKHPYHRMWILEDDTSQRASSITTNFQNSWDIDSGGSEVSVLFMPRSYTNYLYAISILTLIAILSVLVIKVVKRE